MAASRDKGKAVSPVPDESGDVTMEELQLAARNHGLPLEALRYPLTPLGLHYLLIHFDIPTVDARAWRLEIGGRVARPQRLTLAQVRARRQVSVAVTMECAGNGRALFDPRPLSQPWLHEAVGTAEWSGTPLAPLLEEAGVDDEAVDVVFTGLDRGLDGGLEQQYERALSLAEARRPEVLLAYEMNGHPLLPQHGAPLRLVTPGWYGMTNVKWLASITVLNEPFVGYQQQQVYRMRRDPEDPGVPLSRMRPRALMLPPGIPDFFSRRRILPMGRCTVTGRAWSGSGGIESVEVSTDDGDSWEQTLVAPPDLGPWAWQAWTFEWEPSGPGEYVLSCRAQDIGGNSQAEEPGWNVGGYANPAVQRVPVTVVVAG
jgi:DMSO/TMAO reductase YedYZ molybdopterin-dependent catalytic subunit